MASIKDVATAAGVSLSTASIVINGKSEERKISKKTQKKVLDAMHSLNYIPNVSAKSLRRGDSQNYIVALFWNFDFRSTMMHRFLFGVQKKIIESHSNMSIVIHPYQTGNLKKEEQSFLSGEFHAAIIANADSNDLDYLNKSKFRVPIILYNRLLEGYCSVNVDDKNIGRLAADHLFSKGYRRPAVVHGTQNFPGAAKREEGFFERMKEHGLILPENRFIFAGNSIKGGYECGQMMLKAQNIDMADCYFCSSDFIALGLMNAWADKKLIPNKIGIIAIGNNDPQYSKYHVPSLSVINMPIEEMAEQCCQFLIDRMYTLQTTPEIKFFKTELLCRTSTEKESVF